LTSAASAHRTTPIKREFKEVNSTASTYLFFAYQMHADLAPVFEKQPAVWGTVSKEDRKRVRVDDFLDLDLGTVSSGDQVKQPFPELDENKNSSSTPLHSRSPRRSSRAKRSQLTRRTLDRRTSGRTWELSQISVPGGVDWNLPSEPGESTDYRIWNDDDAGTEEYIAYWDDSYGEGQLIYICEQGVLEAHNVRFPLHPAGGMNGEWLQG
jgi:hypothetical protein